MIGLYRGEPILTPETIKLKQDFLAYINKYYVPRDEVEKIIGEDEPLPMDDRNWDDVQSRNALRNEQREKLKSIRR